MEKAPNGPASPDKGVHTKHPIRGLVSGDGGDEEYNNIYSSSVDLVGVNKDLVRHNSWRLLNMNRELPPP
jgi:hypothetical protein